MIKDNKILSLEEAKSILGSKSKGMTDIEIIEVISTLDVLAKDALKPSQTKLLMKRDALALANLVYDIYKEKKSIEVSQD